MMVANTIDPTDASKWSEKLIERVNSSMLKATSMAMQDGVPRDKVAMMVGLAVLSPALGFMVQSTGKPEPTKEQSERLIAEVWNLVRNLEV
jgi:hypothetical protein